MEGMDNFQLSNHWICANYVVILQAVFLIFGAATVAWSAGIFFFLPDEPMNARFLSKTDRSKAVLRVKENMTGVKSNKIKWDQCKEALLDIDCWMIVLIQLCNNIPNGGVASVRLSLHVWQVTQLTISISSLVQSSSKASDTTLSIRCYSKAPPIFVKYS